MSLTETEKETERQTNHTSFNLLPILWTLLPDQQLETEQKAFFKNSYFDIII